MTASKPKSRTQAAARAKPAAASPSKPATHEPSSDKTAGTPQIDLRTAGLYRIAAVSRLTGLPVPTLRMWERRYTVVQPARSAGNGRLYSRQDIDRLLLLKAATESGHAIGTVATLDESQLRTRLQQSQPLTVAAHAPASCRVVVCGTRLGERLRESWSTRSDIAVAAVLPTITSPKLQQLQPADAVIVEAATLQISAVAALRQLRQRCGARVMVVVYGFTQRQALARLDQEGIIAIPLPAEAAHLARICHLGLAMPTDNARTAMNGESLLMRPAAFRRYDDQFLSTVAQLPSSVRCECPNHLADLLNKLNAFEQYSLECENNDAADASIHSLLYSAASHCRALLEHALHRVLLHEGIADLSTEPDPGL